MATTQSNSPRLIVKGIKTFRGHDGTGLNAMLYFDGKKTCEIFDSAHGGEWEMNWFGTTRDERNKIKAEVEAYVATLPTKFTSINLSADHLSSSPAKVRTDLACPKCDGQIEESEGLGSGTGEGQVYVGDLFCRKCNCLYAFMGNTIQSFVDLVVEEQELDKTFKRKCKKSTLIRCKGYAETEYLEFKVTYNPALKPKIMAKYPDCIEIINERYQ